MDGSPKVEGEDMGGGTPRADDGDDVDHGDGDNTWQTRIGTGQGA